MGVKEVTIKLLRTLRLVSNEGKVYVKCDSIIDKKYPGIAAG
jgi:hypothetical protein